jgi:hypothetical protein
MVAASAVDVSVVEEIVGEEIAVGVAVVSRVIVSWVDETRAGGISGWIRCGSGLLRGVRGRLRRMMRLWI